MSRQKYGPAPKDHQIKKVDNFMFDLADQIGAGYSSKVYIGKNCLNGTKVAIKVIELKKLGNDVQKMLLTNQCKALNTINHPNILRAEHTMQTTNNFYIVSELFQQNMENLIRAKGAFSEPEIIQFLAQIGSGLCYLQDKAIIHRDIKPSNIFVANGRYVIGDFGFCHFMHLPCLEQGFNVGSPFYMSPEAYKFSVYSYKSDIWALGISTLELLVGRKPFSGITFDIMVKQICQNKYYRQLNISEDLKMILEGMLERDLEKRMSSFDLVAMLNRLVSKNNAYVSQKKQPRQSENEKPINFKNTHKRKLSISPKPLSNQENLNSPIHAQGSHNNLCPGPLSERKKVNFCDKSNIGTSETCGKSPPNPKFICLEKLSRMLLTDLNLPESVSKLKLLRVLSILPNNQFPISLVPVIQQLPLDHYFNHVLQTTDHRNLVGVSHYLEFLLQSVLKQYQENNESYNEEIMKRIVCLEQALSFWGSANPKKAKIVYSSPRITFSSLERSKSRSTSNLKSNLVIGKVS